MRPTDAVLRLTEWDMNLEKIDFFNMYLIVNMNFVEKSEASFFSVLGLRQRDVWCKRRMKC
jgi:hypothetical protein